MSTPTNQAAWIVAAKAKPFQVKESTFPEPGPTEVVIKHKAIAINPVDWKVQDYDFMVQSYPFILGEDAAGTIHSVGASVTTFKPGDRVLAHYDGLMNQQSTNSSFQYYGKTDAGLVSKLPDNLSFAQGSVLPLALSTAAAGLFQKDMLALPHPVAGGKAAKTGSVLLIWGGSSSVGSVAIQLAAAAGVEVATTASAHNHAFVKEMGAKYVFDHTSSTVVDDIVSALKGKKFVGVYDSISIEDSTRKSAEIAHKLDGSKFVATVLPPPEGLPAEIKTGNVFSLTVTKNEVGPAIWGKFVPEALADGTLKAKPDPLVFGKGLDKLQGACDKNKAGVSAKKVVVELD